MTPSGSPPNSTARLHGGAQRQAIRWVNMAPPPMTISRYRVDIGDSVSLHVHTGKAEYWVIIAGEGLMRLGEEDITVREGDVIVTPPHVAHALLNSGTVILDFLNLVQPVGSEAITTRELAS